MQEQPTSTSRQGDLDTFRQTFAENLYHVHGKTRHTATPNDLYTTLAYTIRDYLVGRWRRTSDAYFEQNPKFVCYLSAEYLTGRQLTQNMLYTETMDLARAVMSEYGLDLDDIVERDIEPGLGNGGLGRLAACFLDSMATLSIPGICYGIRYEYGIFQQSFVDGWQVESPNEWLMLGNPWEYVQPDNMVEVAFGGYTQHYMDADEQYRVRWIPGQRVLGEPYHMLMPGFKTESVNLLRLWRARASREFDFQLFNDGDYARAVEQKVQSETLSKVLYPNDSTPQGKELRLKQQYFFVACSLRDIIRIFHVKNEDWDRFPEHVVIQLNDTHPVVGIPELMRILVDEEHLPWERAWDITRRTFAYTCHTLLPEALEKWPVSLFGRLLPRHLEIVYEINHRFLKEVRERFPDEPERATRMSLIEEGPERLVRMAHLATVGSFSVNGVAQLHTDLLKGNVLNDFYELWPEKFNNKTNGVTPRRFMRLANPRLSELITDTIGEGWLTNLERLEELEPYADDAAFRDAWRLVKRANKTQLAEFIRQRTGIDANPDSVFDVMVKRLHEYKRQLLKVLHIVTLYNRLKHDPEADVLPRTFIFGAKAAPGYQMAKLIIKLINSVADVVNSDPDIGDRLKVVFLENFNVTLGERIYPAADVSEQISLAGKEASGTGNMKFALNGAVTVGTLDGANIEIRERVGDDNFFLFGLTAEEVFAFKSEPYKPMRYYQEGGELKEALDRIIEGHFSDGDRGLFQPIVDSLLYHDEYLLLVDYASYVQSQDRLEEAYRDEEAWTRMSILNTARTGFFSSDRTIRQYCEDVWDVKPVDIPAAVPAE